MIRVLIADDHAGVRAAFRVFLEAEGDIEIAAEATGGPEAVELATTHRPDVVLMDIRMPDGDGLTATAALAGPDVAAPVPVVVVTTFDRDEYLFGALERGACGFLLKDAEPAEIVQAVRSAAAGDGLVSPVVTRRVIQEFARRRGAGGEAPPTDVALTSREEEVLALLAAGLSNAEIAERLVVEVGTVKTHVSSIIGKLGVRDRVQAVVWAYRNHRVAPNGRNRRP